MKNRALEQTVEGSSPWGYNVDGFSTQQPWYLDHRVVKCECSAGPAALLHLEQVIGFLIGISVTGQSRG